MNCFYFLLLFFGGCFIGNTHAECIPTKCEALFPRLSLIRLQNTLPSVENLNNLCPALFEYLECADEMIPDCTGKHLAQLTFSDEEIAENATVLLNIKGLILEICTAHTDLHREYVAAVNCYKRVVREPDGECYRDKVSVSKSKNRRRPMILTDECISVKAAMDCFGMQVREQCSLAASEALSRILGSVRPFSSGICSWEALGEIKKDFIEYVIKKGRSRGSLLGGQKRSYQTRY